MRISDWSSDVCSSDLIARPQFRELAPQQYLDLDNDRLVIGNPFLVDSELLNLDARYEWYFGAGEYFSAGVFYKDIDKPVEAVRSEEHTSELQSLVRISYAVFCLKKKKTITTR